MQNSILRNSIQCFVNYYICIKFNDSNKAINKNKFSVTEKYVLWKIFNSTMNNVCKLHIFIY